MDLNVESLLASLGGRPFSVLAVTTSLSEYSDMGDLGGLKVDWADTGPKAIKCISRHRYDVVLVEQQVDTPEAAIVKFSANRAGRVIVSGEERLRSAHLRAILAGADGYVADDSDWQYEFDSDIVLAKPKTALERGLRASLAGYGKLGSRLYRKLQETVERHDPQLRDLNDIIARVVGEMGVELRPVVSEVTRREVDRVLLDSDKTIASNVDFVPPRGQIIVARGVALATETPTGPESTSAPQMFWNKRFPEDSGILRNTPHLVVARGEYPFETGLSAEPDPRAVSQRLAGDRLLGKSVTFQVSAVNGEMLVPDSSKWNAVVLSPPLACTEQGTPAFSMKFRAKVEGAARIEVFLVIDNGTIARKRIDLLAHGTSPPPSSRKRVADTPRPISPVAVLNSPGADYRLHVGDESAELHVDQTMMQAGLRKNTAAEIGSISRETYKSLLDKAHLHPPIGDIENFQITDPGGSMLELARIGAELHRRLFIRSSGISAPQKLRAIADRLRRAGSLDDPALLQIYASEAYPLPWGLLYDALPDRNRIENLKEVKLEGFWGMRFDIYRSVTSAECDPLRGSRRLVKPVIGSAVPRSDRQLSFVKNLPDGDGDNQLVIEPASCSVDDVKTWAASGDEADLLYFFCHARPAQLGAQLGAATNSAASSFIAFGVTESMNKLDLRQLKKCWKGARQNNPVVFLNACSSGQGDVVFGSPFVDFFMGDWAAQAFIGTDWPVQSGLADVVGRRVLHEILKSRSALRSALRTVVNEAAAERNLFPLMYAIYGPNNVQFVDRG